MPGNDIYKEGPGDGPGGCWPSCAVLLMEQMETFLGVQVVLTQPEYEVSSRVPLFRLACVHGTVFLARRAVVDAADGPVKHYLCETHVACRSEVLFPVETTEEFALVTCPKCVVIVGSGAGS